jgi:hypothetical protein
MLYGERQNRTMGSKSKQKKIGPTEINSLLVSGPFAAAESRGRRAGTGFDSGVMVRENSFLQKSIR